MIGIEYEDGNPGQLYSAQLSYLANLSTLGIARSSTVRSDLTSHSAHQRISLLRQQAKPGKGVFLVEL